MWWIVIIIAVIVLSLFLYIIAHTSAKSLDEDMQRMLDEEQTQIVSELLKEKPDNRKR